jgi:hypothetical protein
MTPVRRESDFRYLRRRTQSLRIQAVGAHARCVVLPFRRQFPHRVGVGVIFRLLDVSGNKHAHRS